MKDSKLFTSIIAVVLIMALLPTMAFAADITAYLDKGGVSVTATGDNAGTVDYVDDAGVSYTGVTFGTGDTVTVTQTAGTSTTNTIAVDTTGGDIAFVLDSVNIATSDVNDRAPVSIIGGNTATVELDGDNTLKYDHHNGYGSNLTHSALEVSGGSTVVIEDENGVNGSIDASAVTLYNGGASTKTNGSGIGNAAGEYATIVINSGIVTASGGSRSAGIGYNGMTNTGGAKVIINGGKINANGGDGNAAIKSEGDSNKVIITGGDITARSYSSGGDGISCGDRVAGEVNISGGKIDSNGYYEAIGGTGATINISGGTIIAHGRGGSGIGGIGVNINITGGDIDAYGNGVGIGGYNAWGATPETAVASSVIIKNAKVTAKGGNTGAGIGGGYKSTPDTYVYIENSTVNAVGGWQYGGAGIGSGINGSCTVEIVSGDITAHGTGQSAGIGTSYTNGAQEHTSTTVIIRGGTINASSGSDSAGIGGAQGSDSTILITGGDITASGSGAGIGTGKGGEATINLDGGTIKANGGSGSAGIGSGAGGNATVVITDGDITAQGGAGGAGIGSGNGGSATVSTPRYHTRTYKTYNWRMPFDGGSKSNFLENVHGGAGAEDVGSGAGGATSDVTFVDTIDNGCGYALVFTLKDTAEKYERYVGWLYLDDYYWFTQGRDTTDWANGFLPLSYNVDGDTLVIETDETDVTLQLDMRGLWDLSVTKVVLKNGGSETTFNMADFDCDLAKIVLEGAATVSTVYDSEAEAA